jgi:bacteriocin-like protein
MQYRELSDEELKSVIGGVSTTSYASQTSGTPPTDASSSATVSSTLTVNSKHILRGKLLSLPTIPTL